MKLLLIGRQEIDMSSVTCSPRQPGGQVGAGSQGPRSHSWNDGTGS